MPESQPFARCRPRERARLSRLIAHLRAAPRTIYELMQLEGCDRKSALVAITYLRGRLHGPRRFRVIGWRRISVSGPPTAVYGRGFSDDAPVTRVPPEVRRARKRASERALRKTLRAIEPSTSAAPAPRDERSFLHTAGRGDDDIEARLDAIAAERAAAIQPRRDAMIWALFGAAQ